LNDESNTHLCNSSMSHRFKKIRNATQNLLASNEFLKIECYETINIELNAFNDCKWRIILNNVAYVSDFLINLMIIRLFRVKQHFFDDQRMIIHHENKIMRLIKHIHDKNVLKNNSTSLINSFVKESSLKWDKMID
jgi:hypothetical protein